MARQREEEEKRKEVSGRFQTTITDIQEQMESHTKRNDKLQADNRELTTKLHTLLEQYEKREEHIQKLMKQKELESQLLETKLSQCQLMMEKEQEKTVEEKKMVCVYTRAFITVCKNKEPHNNSLSLLSVTCCATRQFTMYYCHRRHRHFCSYLHVFGCDVLYTYLGVVWCTCVWMWCIVCARAL